MKRRNAAALRSAAPGFSLLELLVAVAVFAIVAALAWGGLETIVRARGALDRAADDLAKLQRAIGRFEQDASAALPAPWRDAQGRIEPALAGTATGFEATVWLADGESPEAAAVPRRVAWRCDNGTLRRFAVGTTRGSARAERRLFEDLDGCRLRYVAEGGARHDRWPPEGARAESLPRALELAFSLDGQGSFSRLVELPAAAEPAP